MKRSQLPLYAVFALVGLAIIYRIVSPPPPILPGPVGDFPTWKSVATRGDMSAQAISPAGTIWAGAWNEISPDKKEVQSAVRLINFNGNSAASCSMDKDSAVQYLSWADDNTLRALCTRPGNTVEVVYIDGRTGEKKRTTPVGVTIQRVLCWPAGSDRLVVVLEESDKALKIAVLSESGKVLGKEVSIDLPSGGGPDTGAGISADGSRFLFAISDSAARDGRSFYLADTTTGIARKAFDLGDVPGRIEGIWPSAAGVLMVCKVKDKLEDVVFDPATGKLAVKPAGIDLSKWPGAPKTIGFTTYNGGLEFDLATGKTKTVFDTSKKNSDSDKEWRDFLRDSRFYRLASGGFVTVSEGSGAVDIRELKPDGTEVRPLLSRT